MPVNRLDIVKHGENAVGKYLCSSLAAHIARQYHEFIASQARERVATTHSRLQGAGEELQQRVSHGMTVRVVHLLESVQVNEQKCSPASASWV